MPELGEHAYNSFDAVLSSLRKDVVMMSGITERLLENAATGLLKRRNVLCELTIDGDDEVDLFEKKIDHDGVDLLLRFRPVARDMRYVISAMKLSSNLERIADYAVVIARRAKELNQAPAVPEVELIEPLYKEALGIFRDSLWAFIESDSRLALQLKPRDLHLDELNANLNDKLTERMRTDPERVSTYLHIIFIGRALERIGDHATNIAEDAFWVEYVQDIRHTYGKEAEKFL